MKTASSIRDIGLAIDGRKVEVKQMEDGSRWFECDFVAMGIICPTELHERLSEHLKKMISTIAPSLQILMARINERDSLLLCVCLECDQTILGTQLFDTVSEWLTNQSVSFQDDRWDLMSIAHVYVDHFDVLAALLESAAGISLPDNLVPY